MKAQTKAEKTMTEEQQAIINGLIANHFGEIDTSEPHATSLKAIGDAVPDKDDVWIWKELKNWEGVVRVGSGLEDVISIPGKYFK